MMACSHSFMVWQSVPKALSSLPPLPDMVCCGSRGRHVVALDGQIGRVEGAIMSPESDPVPSHTLSVHPLYIGQDSLLSWPVTATSVALPVTAISAEWRSDCIVSCYLLPPSANQ